MVKRGRDEQGVRWGYDSLSIEVRGDMNRERGGEEEREEGRGVGD